VRGLVLELESPHPMGAVLPALYQEDPFAQRLTSALDDVLAPVFAALDNLPAYLDPELAPADFLCWLANWVGVGLDENWPEERQRELVARAADLYRRRGTVFALAEQIALYTGATPEIEDSGGVASSATPGGTMPGTGDPRLVVRVRVPDPESVDVRRLEALVAEAKPAHVPHQVEVSKP
jgi:phage tail-like protein